MIAIFWMAVYGAMWLAGLGIVVYVCLMLGALFLAGVGAVSNLLPDEVSIPEKIAQAPLVTPKKIDQTVEYATDPFFFKGETYVSTQF